MANNTEKRITAKMVLDSTGYNDKLKGLNSEMKKHQSELKLASEGIKTFGKDSEKLKSIQESLSKQVELHSKKVDLYKQSIEKATAKMNDNIRERDRLKQSLDQANRKYEEAVRLYGKESEEVKKAKGNVDKLKQEHDKASKAVETNAKQIQGYETNLNKANSEMVKTQGELKKVTTELDKSNSKWLNASEGLKKSSEKLKDIGGKVSSAGDSILKVTAPLAAGGLASLKFSTDFEDSMAKVSTIADTGEVSMSDLRKGILKLSNDTGIASTEIANNAYDAISAGQKTGDAVNFVANSTKLAKAGYAEAGQSLDLLTTILNSYGMEAKEVTKVSDVLVNTQNLGKVTVGELSSSMGKVIPTAKSLGVNLEQVASGYAIMTSKGIKSAETTTYMNSMFNEMGKTGSAADKAIRKMSGKSFQELIKSGKSVGDVLAGMEKYAKKNKLSLADMFGSAEAGKAALILSADAGKDFNDMLKNMNNTAGITQKTFDKATNTQGERFKKSLNKIKNEAIRFGDAIAPMMDTVSKLIGKLADKLNGLSKEQLDSIVKWGTFALATGGALKVVGGGISTIGNIAGGLSKLTGILGTAKVAVDGVGVASAVAGGVSGVGALTGALGAIAPIALPAIGIIGGLGLAAYGIHKTLSKEVVPSVDLFADKVETTTTNIKDEWGNMATQIETNTIKISETTKQAVGAYVELDKNATQVLNNLYFNSTTITEKNKNEIVAKYNEMGATINNGLKQKRDENINNLTEFFGKSTAITDREEAEILKKTNKYYADKKGVVDIYQKQIQDILEKAKNEHRSITLEESETIADIQNRMKEQAINALSKNEVEAKVIMERMKEYNGRITAEQAAEHIKQLNRGKDEAVKIANDEYDKRVATIIKMRDESKSISVEQADALIKDAERQKNQIIEKAENTRIGAIDKIRSMNSDLESQVDTSTGKILTTWDKIKRWWKGWEPEKKSFKYNIGGSGSGSGGRQISAAMNWTGTNYWQGGLTYLHDAPGQNPNYELYDLPRGTRIFNHDASEDLVIKTAESVAKKVANSILKNFDGNNGDVIVNIYSPKALSEAEAARQFERSQKKLALGI